MAAMIERLGILVKERKEDFPVILKNAQNAEKDRDGSASSSVVHALRFLGVAEFVLNGDAKDFKQKLSEAARIRLRLFERFEKGEPISKSYVTMLNYQAVFNALAAGDQEVAKSLAIQMGGRDAIEKQHDHPFDYAFGYTLKSFVLDLQPEMSEWAQKFSEVCQKSDNRDFRGYAAVFHAILAKDAGMAQEGLQAIVNGHRKLSKGRRVFKNTVDEVLCVWGLGMANLARSRGLDVAGVAPLIPPELLV